MKVNCPSCGEITQDDRTGNPPVCMSCGQMVSPDPEEMYEDMQNLKKENGELFRLLKLAMYALSNSDSVAYSMVAASTDAKLLARLEKEDDT